jgi:hypothetical protein
MEKPTFCIVILTEDSLYFALDHIVDVMVIVLAGSTLGLLKPKTCKINNLLFFR